MGVVSQQFAISLHFRAGKIIHDILPNCNTKLQIGCNFMLWNIAACKNTILNGLRCLQVAAAYLLALPQRRAFVESGAANAVFLHNSTRENGIPERPQTLRYSKIINIFSLIYAQSNAERIPNRPTRQGSCGLFYPFSGTKPTRSLTTSPPMIRPATEGTKALEPGTVRRAVHLR